MKYLTLILGLTFLTSVGFSQKYMTKNGHIKFYSETPMETIEAHNRQVNSALDITSGDFVFKVLMKSFEFEKALMQEHFNENYVESDKYPNATFQGKVSNLDKIDFKTAGEYKVLVDGELTIHGVTMKVAESGTFTVLDGKIDAISTFIVKPQDYKIKIPNTVIDNIADEIEVTVNVSMDALKK
ncbi:MAG: YceI family protein [Bacteroidales bacterium]